MRLEQGMRCEQYKKCWRHWWRHVYSTLINKVYSKSICDLKKMKIIKNNFFIFLKIVQSLAFLRLAKTVVTFLFGKV